MDIEVLSKVAGVLGFVQSIAVFVLTRFERRKTVAIELEPNEVNKFISTDELCLWEGRHTSTVLIRITNMSGLPIAINKDSFVITGAGQSILTSSCDWYGRHKIPTPLAPHECIEMAIFMSDFELIITKDGKNELFVPEKQDDYEGAGQTVQLCIKFRDLDGKLYKCKDYAHNFYNGTFYRRQKYGIHKIPFFKKWKPFIEDYTV